MSRSVGDRSFEVSYRDFVEILDMAIKVSKLGGCRRSTGFRMTFASVLFTKMCVISTSIKKLSSQENIANQEDEHWDYASLFSLTRNLMECFHVLFYLCLENISEEERVTRKNILNIHDYESRGQLFALMEDCTNKKFEQKESDKCFDYIMSEFNKDSYFQALPDREKKQYISGKKAFLMSREEIQERSGADKKTFRMWYKLLSANTHSYPLGFFHMTFGERGTGVKTVVEEKYSSMALNISEFYLIRGIYGMINDIYPDIKEKLNARERELLQLYAKT